MAELGSSWQFAVCVRNDGYPGSLQLRRLYQVLPDSHAAQRRMVRVIDESGEDFLYPSDYLVPVNVPRQAAKALYAVV